jgi:hypothetical protein
MIKPKLTLFQMQMEGLFTHPSESGKPGLGIAPEALDSIDMAFAMNKFILTVVDSEVLFVTKVDQAIIPTPAIRMDDASEIYTTSNYRLQLGSSVIRDNFSKDFALAFEDAKNNSFAESTTASFSLYSSSAKVAFINLNLSGKRGLTLTKFGNPLPDLSEVSVNSIPVQAGNFCNLRGIQIK